MKYLELKDKLKLNLFSFLDVTKLFSNENPQLIKTQLYRFAKKGLIEQIKRELYCFDPLTVDEFELANRLYQPSYISLETALNYYGIIPDIPQLVTSVNLTTTKKITNQFGVFHYVKIKPMLFFGFTKIKSARLAGYFNLAQKEKALLDFLYLRKIKNLASLRLNFKEIDLKIYQDFIKSFPEWVQKIKPCLTANSL